MEDRIQQHDTHIHLLTALPEQVDAGTDVLLKVQVSCPESCSLLGGKVRVADGEGNVVKDVDLVSFDGTVNQTDEFSATVPVEPGPCTWTVLFLPGDAGSFQHATSSTSLDFTVVPHTISALAWGAPFPVIKGSEFRVKVGAKCSAACSLAGLSFAIYDGEGTLQGTGQLGDELLPMTTGLRWTEHQLVAPSEEGVYTWTVQWMASELDVPHEASGSNFNLKTATRPDQVVTVEVVDQDRKTPIQGASIFMHPYRESTDERGIGCINVGKGTHELYVKKQDYQDFKTTVNVDADVTVKVELFWVPDPYG